jgi:predicted ATPase
MAVYVITGPPAAGKSTYVREHAKPGDITIDYDTLAQALSPDLPADPALQPPHVAAIANAARDGAINEATDASNDGECDVYLIHAMPDRHATNRYRKHGFTIVPIDPGHEECIRRANAERTPRQVAIVQDWYERRGLV